MTTVYLHIGTPKTATSTLQSVFARKEEKLLKKGILYPKKLRHGHAQHLLVCDTVDKYRDIKSPDFWYGPVARGVAWQRLQEEMEECENSFDKVLLSSELFYAQASNRNRVLDEFAKALSPMDVKVVVYLRRQDEFYSSFYNQDVKGARQWHESAYEFFRTHEMLQFSYEEALNNWAKHFGKDNIIIRSFEREQMVGGDIVEDFCHILGISPLSGSAPVENEALGENQLYLKRCLNRLGFPKEENENLLTQLQKLIPETARKNVIYIRKKHFREDCAAWQKCNSRLADSYNGGKALFQKAFVDAEEANCYALDEKIILDFILRVAAELKRGKKISPQFKGHFAKTAMYAAVDLDLLAKIDQKKINILMTHCRQ